MWVWEWTRPAHLGCPRGSLASPGRSERRRGRAPALGAQLLPGNATASWYEGVWSSHHPHTPSSPDCQAAGTHPPSGVPRRDLCLSCHLYISRSCEIAGCVYEVKVWRPGRVKSPSNCDVVAGCETPCVRSNTRVIYDSVCPAALNDRGSLPSLSQADPQEWSGC